jgi:hypothetical protein
MSTTATESKTTEKQLQPPNSDFYHFADTLSADERAILQRVQSFRDTARVLRGTRYHRDQRVYLRPQTSRRAFRRLANQEEC